MNKHVQLAYDWLVSKLTDEERKALDTIVQGLTIPTLLEKGSHLDEAQKIFLPDPRLVFSPTSSSGRVLAQPEAREEDKSAQQWREAYLRQCSDSSFLAQKIQDLEAEREHWCEPLRAEIAALSRLAEKEGQDETALRKQIADTVYKALMTVPTNTPTPQYAASIAVNAILVPEPATPTMSEKPDEGKR